MDISSVVRSWVFGLALGAAAGACAAETVRVGGNGGSLPVMQALGEAFRKQHPEVSFVIVPSLGSSGGIEALLKGVLDVAVSARPVKDSERATGAVEAEYGRAPFAFVTSAKGVSDITLRQVAEIYAGKMDKWPDGSRIRLVLRPLGDSDGELVKRMSPEIRAAKTLAEGRPGVPFAVTDQQNAEMLEKIAGSFGAATVPQIVLEKRALTVLRLDGRAPSARALADGSYPHYKKLYIVSGPKTQASARSFVEFVRSPAGRKILADTGHWVPD